VIKKETRQNMEIKKLHKYLSKRWFRNRIRSTNPNQQHLSYMTHIAT